MFSSISEEDVQSLFNSYCTYKTKGPVGTSEVEILDDRSEKHLFAIESFAIPQGDVLTLAQWIRKCPITVSF